MDKSNIISLNFTQGDYSTPNPIEKYQNDSTLMVPFGDNNMFPNELISLVEKTSLVSMIIDKVSKYVFGGGIELMSDNANPDTTMDEKGTTLSDLVYGLITDYITFGAFALQVRRNNFNEIKFLNRIRVERLRTNEDNSKLWYSSKWTKYAKANVVYDAFNGTPAQKDSIFYFKNPTSRHVYGYAPYWSSLADMSTMYALSEYGLHVVENAFTPSAVISLVEGKPTQDEAREIEKEINAKFAGTKNAAKLLVTFSDSPEGAPKVTPFAAADMNAHYLSLKETTRDNIFGAFGMSPLLVGIHNGDGIFNQDSFEQEFKLFNKTEIEPIQKQFIKAFKKLGYDIVFKPFKIEWDELKQEQADKNIIAE